MTGILRHTFLLVVTLNPYAPLVAVEVAFEDDKQGTLHISLDGNHLANFVYQDDQIPRPYFSSVTAPGGVQVTRNQPPDPKLDVADHPLFHPGIWLSFGILDDSDYWRNTAQTEFIEFSSPPRIIGDRGQFTAAFRYLNQKTPSETVCQESFKCDIVPIEAGILILWDSTFSSDRAFAFGDQEEMGLGIRMATGLRSERQARGDISPGTGTIVDANGRKNGAEIWGNTSPWCDYSGTIDGKPVGATLFCHPDNFRPSWFHARDYGLLVANPFARKAFKQGDTSLVVIKPDEEFRLRYGILLHSGVSPDLEAAYQEYVDLAASQR